MIGQQKLKTITDYILKKSPALETEVLIFVDDSALTRFANNQIHQNMASQNIVVQIRAVVGKKQAVVSANLQLDQLAKLDKLVNQAYEIAKISPEDPHWHHLPGKEEGNFSYQKVKSFNEATASVKPEYRAKEVAKIIKMAKAEDLNAFGSLSTGTGEIVVANSHGVFAYHPQSLSLLNIRIMKNLISGYAGEVNSDIAKLNIEEAAKRAISKTLLGKKTSEVEVGDYEVVLEEPAVSEMMTYLTYLGFGARAFHEERSFISENLSKKVMGSNITIWDDAYNPNHLPMPFDYQGIPKKSLTIIENGIAKNVLYDHYLALKYKAKPTGHGFPAPNTEDAFASHLHLKPGSTPKNQLLKGMKKGILVSRFWYVRNVHPKELTITGMTRDGTFLIENGEIVSGVRNMRFTISIPKVLSNVSHISKEVHLEPSDEGFGASLLPAIRVRDFSFTGISKL
ncbi:TldD/PmbA family protein [Candidatus Gottesmanbacteria bacterium]|nr:TldD/PmbA family protein [Candidatus Gottesmanbacteria bacterium]